MTPDELRELLRQPEGEDLEFKIGLPSRDATTRTLASFANSGGGTLILGFDERNQEPVGLSHPGVALANIRDWASTQISPPPPIETETVELESGRTLAVVRIEPSPELHIADGRALLRRGSRDAPMTEAEVRDVVARSEPDQLAVAITALTTEVEVLGERMTWKKQLPLQLVLLVVGVMAGYALGLWNPLG